MMLFKNKHFYFALCLAFAFTAAAKNEVPMTNNNKSFSQRLMHSVKDCVLWPYRVFKENLPSKRFKRAAVEASNNFNDELRITIDDGSKHIENIVKKVDLTINEGSTQANTIIKQFEQSLNQNILYAKKAVTDIIDKGIKDYNDSRYDHYQKIEKMSTVGATVIVKTVCLSASAIAGALLLYNHLNNYSGPKSIFFATIGAGMLGGSGFIAEKTLQLKTTANNPVNYC